MKIEKKVETVPSLIARKDSTNIKGVLILLIVLGHDMLLNHSTADGSWLPHRLWIYLFHVHCFFILPWIYGYTPHILGRRWDNIFYDTKKAFVRLIVPYFFFCLFFAFFNACKKNTDWISMAEAFIIGEQSLLSHTFNVHFLWFLPAMFGMLVWKSVFYNASKQVRILLLCTSLVIVFLRTFKITNIIPIMDLLPFAMVRGLYYLSWGVIARFLFQRFGVLVCLGGVLLITAEYFINDYRVSPYYNLYIIECMAMTIFMIILLYHLRKYWDNNFLSLLGRLSLYIYLYNVIIFNIVNPLLLRLLRFDFCTYLLGIISYVVTLAICVVLSYYTDKTKFIKKIVFPSI